MLEVNQLNAGYPGRPVLRNLNVSFPSGQVTAILGPNGCGKSTLLKAICGILPVRQGSIRLDGQDLGGLDPKKLAQKVAYLSQSRQVPDITVRRLVLHGRFPYLSYPRRYREADYAAVNAAMEQMGITGLADSKLQQLSGGQRQKAYIAMALAQRTDVILLDEPTTYLDIRHQMRMLSYARELAGEGKTVVLVVHDISQALQTAGQVVLMAEGQVVLSGTPEEIAASGQIEGVFGVKLGRVLTDTGWRYYCEEG